MTITDPDVQIHTSFPWALDHIRSEIQKKSGTNWDTLIALSSNSLCQDPRDKIYGLLGLAGSCSQELIPVDYNKSLFEVYTNALKAYISENPGNSIVTFSYLLQQALLFPNEKDAGLAELMRDRRQAKSCSEGEGMSIPLAGREIDVIEAVSTIASVLTQAARKIWKSPDPKRRKAKTRSEYIQACWTVALTLALAQTDVVHAVFVTDSRRMGVCAATAVEGDYLFVLSGRYEVPLIVDKSNMKVKGRAYMAKEDINTSKGIYMYLPGPDFATIPIQCGALPIRPDLEELEKTVTVNEHELQAMSYPVDMFKPKHVDHVKEPVPNSYPVIDGE